MDIYETVFYDILQIDRSSTLITGDFGHDIVFGLLIPSVLLILILKEFGKFFAGDSKLAGTLVPIAGLAAIIVGGFYGVIAQFSSMLFVLMLAMFIIVYFKRRLITRGQEGAITGAISSVAGDRVDRALKRANPGEKDKAERELQRMAREWVKYEEQLVKLAGRAKVEGKDTKFIGGKTIDELIKETEEKRNESELKMFDIVRDFKFDEKKVKKLVNNDNLTKSLSSI